MARPHEVAISCKSGAQAERIEKIVWDALRTGRGLIDSDGWIDFEIETRDVTPCDATVNHGPGHQSTTRCSVKGVHETHEGKPVHGATIMGAWEEWFVDDHGQAKEPW